MMQIFISSCKEPLRAMADHFVLARNHDGKYRADSIVRVYTRFSYVSAFIEISKSREIQPFGKSQSSLEIKSSEMFDSDMWCIHNLFRKMIVFFKYMTLWKSKEEEDGQSQANQSLNYLYNPKLVRIAQEEISS